MSLSTLKKQQQETKTEMFLFRLKCENEGIMEVFWCMPTTVMSSSILLLKTYSGENPKKSQ